MTTDTLNPDEATRRALEKARVLYRAEKEKSRARDRRDSLIGRALLVFLSCISVVVLAYILRPVTLTPPIILTQKPHPEPAATMLRAPAIAICHGGGPMPLLNDPAHEHVVASLRGRVPKLLHLQSEQQPKAILLVTAHWETSIPCISNGSKPAMLYDYGGFPREAYSITYDAPGSPETASLVAQTLRDSGLKSRMDGTRGWDHGVFVPLKVINPAADIPVVQMSVLASQSAAELFALGRALAPLREQQVAIVGSGSASFHNLREWFGGATTSPSFRARHAAWAAAMDGAVLTRPLDERGAKMSGWRAWPGADSMHPPGAAEHLSPLIVCAGAGGEQVAESWSDELMGVPMKSYAWT